MSKSQAPKSTPPFSMDALMRDTVALERIAAAFEDVADALAMCAKLMAQEYEAKHPIVAERKPVTVATYKPPRVGAEEEAPIPLETDIDISPTTGKATFRGRPKVV